MSLTYPQPCRWASSTVVSTLSCISPIRCKQMERVLCLKSEWTNEWTDGRTDESISKLLADQIAFNACEQGWDRSQCLCACVRWRCLDVVFWLFLCVGYADRQTGRKWEGSGKQDVKGSKCFQPCVILVERDDERTGTWLQEMTLKFKPRRSQNFSERQFSYVIFSL